MFSNKDVFNEIIDVSYSEIGKKFYLIRYYYDSINWDFNFDSSIALHKNNYGKDPLFIYLELNIETEDWNKPYSILQFALSLETIIKEKKAEYQYHQDDEDFVTNGFGIKFPIKNLDNMIKPDMQYALLTTEELLQEAKSSLMQNLDSDILTTLFTFPEHIKTACKQYLIYFAQFLIDLGIEADTEITDDFNTTLFKVVPKNKEESLEVIKNALTTYINAPEFKDNEIVNFSNDIAAQQWQSNIYHFKSQLALANSMIQLKDATIQSLQISNFQYKSLLETEIVANKAKNEEDIIEGLVSVNKYVGKGFSINLPEIVRKLKRKLL
jgi:hypothetical protein